MRKGDTLRHGMKGCHLENIFKVFCHSNGNILKLWKWLNDEKQLFWFRFRYVNKHLNLGNCYNHFNCDILARAIFSNLARSCLLMTLTFRIIWIHQLLCQCLSFPLYNTHTQHGCPSQMTSNLIILFPVCSSHAWFAHFCEITKLIFLRYVYWLIALFVVSWCLHRHGRFIWWR